MNNRFLPDWLYGALPYSYVGGGLMAIVIVQNRLAIASGLVMLAAASAIAFLRWRHQPLPRSAQQAMSESGLVETSWQRAYESGNRIIDDKRRRVLGLSNELVDAVLTRKPKPDMDLMLQDFFDYLAGYFASEEALLEAAGRPLRRGHQEAHQEVMARSRGLMSQYRLGNLTLNDLIGFITEEILAGHIVPESEELAAAYRNANPADGWSDTEKTRRESQDTVLRMVRAEPESGNPAFLSLAALDRLTPAKALFNSYPHVWQRVCVLTQQPNHLERYLDGLLAEQGADGHLGFSLPALKEIGEVYTQNLRYVAHRDVWEHAV